MSGRVDPANVAGFANLSAEAQTLVRRVAADRNELERRDGFAGVSTADIGMLAAELHQSADGVEPIAIREAMDFVRANRAELFVLDRARGHMPGDRIPGTRATATIEAKLRGMTNREKASLLVMEYGSSRFVPKSGAVIVNQTHLRSGELGHLQQTVGRYEARNETTLLVAADQEGGRINRLRRMPGYEAVRFPSAGEMQHMTEEQIRAEGEKTGRGLAGAGVNVLLGPVLDVSDPRSLMARMGRSFGDTPEDVVARAGAFAEGVTAAHPGVALIAKHFPGYNVRGNSDVTLVTDSSSLDEIRERARPFFEIQTLDGVMLNSIRYDAFGGEPAVYSPEAVRWIRAELGDVIIMTDDLYASSLLSEEVRAYKEWAIQSHRAGSSG